MSSRRSAARCDPLTVRWYRRLVRLYPAALRGAHEDEMVEIVERRWQRVRRASLPARGGFCIRVIADCVLQCGMAWIEQARHAGGGPLARAAPIEHNRGSVTSLAPAGPAAKAAAFLSGLLHDLRLAGRSLRRAPGFTAVAVLVLTLGIGANTAIFGITHAVLLDPLPYPEPDRLVAVAEQPWTPTEIGLDLRRAASFAEVAGFYPRRLIVTGLDEPLEVEGAAVTPNFFELFGARPIRGRGFTAEDVDAGAVRTAIIGHAAWQRLYGGAEDVIGTSVEIDGQEHEIVGVLEPDFRLWAARAEDPQVWLPLALLPSEPDGAFNWEIPIARLAQDATLQQAQAQLDGILARFRERHPEVDGVARWNLRLATLKDVLVGDVSSALWVLQAAVTLVLLLASANVANLMLVRSGARSQELAVRLAIGASRGHLLRVLLSESLLLSLLAGVAALLLASVGGSAWRTLMPAELPRFEQLRLNAPVFGFMMLACLGAAALCSMVPIFTLDRRGLHDALKANGRSVGGSRRRHRVSQGLAAAEVCLTLVLLVSAGLLGRSFLTLIDRDPGFRTTDITAVSIRLSANRYTRVEQLEDFFRRVRLEITRIPGVDAVTVSNYLPASMGATREYIVEGAIGRRDAVAQYGVVSVDYFRLLDIPLLRGRVFEATDDRGAPPVAVIDEAMARAAWPGQDPVGKRFRMSDDEPWITVVGLVGDVRGGGLAREPRPSFYVSNQQRAITPVELAVGRSAVIMVRSPLHLDRLAAPLRGAVQRVDPLQPVPDIATLDRVMAAQVSPERFRAAVLGIFAVIALLTAMAGVYGVVAYLVSERTRDLGIRLALGATPRDLMMDILGWGLRLTLIGAAIGLAVVLAATRYLSSLLFEVSPTDPTTMVLSICVIALATLGACLAPARRAMRLDPALSMRRRG